MDDVYHATDTVEETISVSKDLKKLLLLGSFNVTKWSSNSLETMKSIPKEDHNPNNTKVSTILPPTPKLGERDKQRSTIVTERVLGIQWSVSRDSFVINCKKFKKVDLENPNQRKISKSVLRRVLSLPLLGYFWNCLMVVSRIRCTLKAYLTN